MKIGITFQGLLPALTGFKHADKVSHAIYGALVAILGMFIGGYFDKPAAGALITGTTIALGKEIYDTVNRDKDISMDTLLDILATTLPAVVIAVTLV